MQKPIQPNFSLSFSVIMSQARGNDMVGPFTCNAKDCGSRFFSHSGLLSHVLETHQTVVNKDAPFVCDVKDCNLRFYTHSGLTLHTLQTHQAGEKRAQVVTVEALQDWTRTIRIQAETKRAEDEKKEREMELLSLWQKYEGCINEFNELAFAAGKKHAEKANASKSFEFAWNVRNHKLLNQRVNTRQFFDVKEWFEHENWHVAVFNEDGEDKHPGRVTRVVFSCVFD